MKDKIRLCLIGNFLSKYGATPQICESLHLNFLKEGYSAIRAGRYKNKFARVWDMILSLILKKSEYDAVIIDTFSGDAFWWAYLSGKTAKLLNKPYISVLHGGNLPEFYRKHKNSVEKYLKNAKYIVSPSPYLRKWAESLGFNAVEIPNPLDLGKYTFKERDKIKPNIYWLRRYNSIYNPAMAVRVIAKLKEKYLTCSLVMAGPDSGEKSKCIKLARKLGVSENIIFKNKLTKKQINLIGQERDIFINTTHTDNTPFTLVEAAALGLPIVSTNVGGVPDLFENNREVLLVSDNDINGMAKAIGNLIENPKLTRKLAANARKKVEEFSWEKSKLKWEALFLQIQDG